MVYMKQSKLIEEVINVYNSQKERDIQKAKDDRLHNTKLLLKHYQEFKLYTDKTKGATSSRLSLGEKNVLATITFGDGEEIINSIKETTKRTVAMVQYIDKALETLEFMYNQEKNERDFNVLKKRYIEGWSIPKLSEFYSMHERNVYKVLDNVTERLSVLLFGIYGVDIQGKI